MTKRTKRGARLWYFRTDSGRHYGLADHPPNYETCQHIDSGYHCGAMIWKRKPSGLRALKPGECVEVEVREVEEGNGDA